MPLEIHMKTMLKNNNVNRTVDLCLSNPDEDEADDRVDDDGEKAWVKCPKETSNGKTKDKYVQYKRIVEIRNPELATQAGLDRFKKGEIKEKIKKSKAYCIKTRPK